MKKGFTLVELIGVIILLGVIALIAYPTITKTIENSKEKAYQEQIRQIENAAKRYGIEHETELSMDKGNKITISTLIKEGYIAKPKDGKVYDPRNSKELNGCVIAKYDASYNQYIYQYNPTCSLGKNCTFDGEMVRGAQFIEGQYMYIYLQQMAMDISTGDLALSDMDRGWYARLADPSSTDPVTTTFCATINNEPVTSMAMMFAGSQATSIDFSSFDTSNVTNMSNMFSSAKTTTGYARTQADADKFNASTNKPSTLTFVVKPT